MDDLAAIRRGTTEWTAWRVACEALRDLGININEEERLHAALVAWGEELVALRVPQDPALRERVLTEKRSNAIRLLADLMKRVEEE